MYYNNRQPIYRQKVFPQRKVFHTEVKDGVTVFVEGSLPDPYKDIPCDSLKIKSRIETGVFVDHEGAPRRLEKAQGSDIMEAEIERQQAEYERKKDESIKRENREKLKKEMIARNPEVEPLLN